MQEAKAFVVDAKAFRKDWEAHGPMVQGLDPLEAMERLRKYQQMFEVRLAVDAAHNRLVHLARSATYTWARCTKECWPHIAALE